MSNNNLWHKLSAAQKQDLINKYIDNIEIELNKNKKPVIKKINIKENKVVDFGISFRHDIYNLLPNENENINISINDSLYNYYNLSIKNLKGNMINVDNLKNISTENINLISI